MPLSHNELDAHAKDKYIPVLQDQFYYGFPLMVQLMSKAKVVYDSGKSILQPVLYGDENSGWYSGLDPFDISLKESTTLAEFNWKMNWTNITITGEDEMKVEGDEKILSLFETKMENASMTFKRNFTQAMYTSQGSKALVPISDAISTTGTYGGISKDEEEWWRGQYSTTGGAFSMDMLQEDYGACSDGLTHPDLIITTQDIYNKIWLRVQPQQRGDLSATPALAKIGFSGINFNQATIIVDKYFPSGCWAMLNTNTWKCVVHKKRNMYWTPPKTPINADAYVRQLLWMGALFCVAPRWNAYRTGVT